LVSLGKEGRIFTEGGVQTQGGKPSSSFVRDRREVELTREEAEKAPHLWKLERGSHGAKFERRGDRKKTQGLKLY